MLKRNVIANTSSSGLVVMVVVGKWRRGRLSLLEKGLSSGQVDCQCRSLKKFPAPGKGLTDDGADKRNWPVHQCSNPCLAGAHPADADSG